MDVKKIATEIYKSVDQTYSIPRFFNDLMVQAITEKLKEQLIEVTKEINEQTDNMLKNSKDCTPEKIIALTYDRVLLNLGLRNEGTVETP